MYGGGIDLYQRGYCVNQNPEVGCNLCSRFVPSARLQLHNDTVYRTFAIASCTANLC